MSELHPISDVCTDPQRKDMRKADVLSVHGLGGHHALTVWRSDRGVDLRPQRLPDEYPEAAMRMLPCAASPSAWFRRSKRPSLIWAHGLSGFLATATAMPEMARRRHDHPHSRNDFALPECKAAAFAV